LSKTPMPPAKSPAKQRPAKSPAKARSASPKPVKSPATSKAAATPKSAKAASEPVAPLPVTQAQPPAAAPVAPPPKAAPAKPTATATKPKSSNAGMISVIVGVVTAIVVGALAYGYTKMAAPPEPIGWVSSKSFDGTTLKMKGASSAMLIFMDRLPECELCGALKAELSDAGFLAAVDGWKKTNLLKVGKVKCWKNQELCRELGVSGDDETATGFPHILHFKGGEKVGNIDARTAADLEKWVVEKQQKEEL